MIIATTRTKNEEDNIEKFCRSYLEYDLADAVFVADGGSDDRTVEIAQSIPCVDVREYSGQVFNEESITGAHWRNPHGEHINFINDWAIEEGADWVLFDDCDCTPNHNLKILGRELLEDSKKDFVYAVRMYFWGDGLWFPSLSIDFKKGADAWMYSLWGWRASSGFRAKEDDPWRHEFNMIIQSEDYTKIIPPLALLHKPWPTEKATQKKLKFYRQIGQHPTMLHPTEFGGDTEPIIEWME